MNKYKSLSLALTVFALVACDDKQNVDIKPDSSGSDPSIDNTFVTSEPSGAVSVLDARKDPKAGKEITVVGRIGGTKKPFAEGYASLVLLDSSVRTCERIPGDECETPWDACCVDLDHFECQAGYPCKLPVQRVAL